jgi:mono/diheme cytochrome c family protein
MFSGRKMRMVKRSFWVALAGLCTLSQGQAADLNQKFTKEVRPLFEKYCFNCHKAERAKGGVDLSKFNDLDSVIHDARGWEVIVRVMRDREMPPEDKKQPSQAERESMIAWGRDALGSIDFNTVKDPGRKVAHRLNRAEYNNTVRDLFNVGIKPADNFPADGGGGGGFDNNADTLFTPPILMEKYLEAADAVLKAARPEYVFVVPKLSRISERTTAIKNLEYHLPRAFRRPVEQAEFAKYFLLYEKTVKEGGTYEEGLKLALKAMLVSPNFLFRIETEKPGKEAHTLTGHELATRLSYFLWSTMPDQELMDLARQNKLHDPATLQAENFAGQWLGVNKLKTTAEPDRKKYPMYTNSLRDAMHDEPIVFFQDLVRRNVSLINLLDSDYTFVNEELAKHYGLPPVTGTELRQIALKDRNRGGLFGMGGIHVLTSYPQRTSPVLRGKWVLEEVLGTPAPPPPPNAGGLPADEAPREGLTFRQRLEKHRSKAECASCHNKMDPIGFGLENFDAIGRWRDSIGKEKVDATGEFSSGVKFTGPAELKKVLLLQKDQFIHNLTEKMLAYALGRGLEYYDVPSVKKIKAEVAKADFRAEALVMEVVKSYPFQHRRGSEWQEKVASK